MDVSFSVYTTAQEDYDKNPKSYWYKVTVCFLERTWLLLNTKLVFNDDTRDGGLQGDHALKPSW